MIRARLRPADPVPVRVHGPDPAAATPAEQELRDLACPANGPSPLPDQLTRLCTSLIRRCPPTGLPSGWHSVLNAADRADGPRMHVDIGTALPLVDGISVRLDALASWPDSWDLYLQATPGWWTYSTDGQRKRAIPVSAEDDLGGRGGHEATAVPVDAPVPGAAADPQITRKILYR